MHKAFISWRSFVPPSLSPCHLVFVAWQHHFHLTEERCFLAYPSCPYAVSLPIPSRPYRASLVHVSLPPSRTLGGYFLLWLPIAYGEWQHAYAPPCTSPCLSQWAPAPWPCLDMDYPRIPHPNSYKPKPNGLSPFCHLPEESDSFLLFGKSDLSTYQRVLHFFVCMTVIGTFQESGEWQHLHKFLCTRPDCTFQEIMAWSLFGFPSGPLPVYILFSTKETAKTAGPTAPLAVYPRFNCPTAVGVTGPTAQLAVASKIQLLIGISC